MPEESGEGAAKVTFYDSRFTPPLPLPRSFYEPSAEQVAPLLLGHWLLRKTPAGLCGGVIVETEAYLAHDPASHGFKRQTPRNRAMFGPPGHAYLYFIYGNHWCFNAVCQPSGVAEAVLIRGIEPVFGIGAMELRRPVAKRTDLTSGPAKLCAALDLDRQHDGLDLCDAGSSVFVAKNPDRLRLLRHLGPTTTTPRIGLRLAADWPLRFHLAASAFVSRRSTVSSRKTRC